MNMSAFVSRCRVSQLALLMAAACYQGHAWAAGRDAALQQALHGGDTSPVLQTFVFVSALSFLPVLIISLTSFTRIIVVLSMLRQALGLQQTPPNSVLITLALFLSLFTMMPTISAIRATAYDPYSHKQISFSEAMERGFKPLKQFMLHQTHESDLAMILDVAKAPRPKSADEVQAIHLIPAFMLSELKTAFEIGFIIYLPFLLIDLVVAAILMSLGMIMVPPTTISLPVKVMLFVLINGWALVARALLESFKPG